MQVGRSTCSPSQSSQSGSDDFPRLPRPRPVLSCPVLSCQLQPPAPPASSSLLNLDYICPYCDPVPLCLARSTEPVLPPHPQPRSSKSSPSILFCGILKAWPSSGRLVFYLTCHQHVTWATNLADLSRRLRTASTHSVDPFAVFHRFSNAPNCYKSFPLLQDHVRYILKNKTKEKRKQKGTRDKKKTKEQRIQRTRPLLFLNAVLARLTTSQVRLPRPKTTLQTAALPANRSTWTNPPTPVPFHPSPTRTTHSLRRHPSISPATSSQHLTYPRRTATPTKSPNPFRPRLRI